MDGHVPVSWSPAPGVRVRWQRDRRYPTANVRVLVHRRVDDEPAKAAVLARTLESACAAWPTRQALAWRLADLYDAALDVTTESYGGRAALVASLDWPLAGVPAPGNALEEGFALLGEVIAEPLREASGALDAALLARARQEVLRELASRSDDKARAATRKAVELSCPDHAISVAKDGRGPEVAHVDGASVAALHARIGELTFGRLRRTDPSNVLLAPEDRICITMLEMLNVEGIVLEPAGALSVDVLPQIAEEIRGRTVVCVTSGGNFDFERLPEVKERAQRFAGLKKYFILRMPQRPGALREFLTMLGPEDDIARFEYLKKSARNFGSVLIGIETRHAENFTRLTGTLDEAGFSYRDITDDEALAEFMI